MEKIATSVLETYNARIARFSNPTTEDRVITLFELGSGTGIFTRLFANYFANFLQNIHENEVRKGFQSPKLRFRIICIEPLPSMRDQFTVTLTKKLNSPNIDPLEKEALQCLIVSDGSATAMPSSDQLVALCAQQSPSCPSGSFRHVDGILMAQAFHWFATTEALTSMAEVLDPSAKAYIIWNRYRDIPGTWHSEVFDKIIDPLYNAQDVPSQLGIDWEKAFREHRQYQKTLGKKLYFNPHPDHFKYDGVTYYFDEEELRQRFSTVSVVASLPPEQKAKTLENIVNLTRKYIADHPNSNRRPGEPVIHPEKEFVMRYIVDLHIAALEED